MYYVATALLGADGNLIYDYTEDFKKLDTAIDGMCRINLGARKELSIFSVMRNISVIRFTKNIYARRTAIP